MSIVVLGATGHLGRFAVEHLLERGVAPAEIVATGRAVEKLTDLAARGVDVRAVDRDDEAAVAAVLEGATKVLLVSGIEPQRLAQHKTVIAAAEKAGVEQLVYTSGPKATESDMLLMADHKATEEALAASSVPSTVLRNAWYVENYTDQVGIWKEHGYAGAADPDAPISVALRSEYGEAAAVALTTEGHLGKTYELGGEQVSSNQIAATVSAVVGQEITYTQVPVETYQQILAGAGVPAPMDAVLADVDRAISTGGVLVPPTDLEALLGRPATALRPAVESILG
ncbi:NmrA family NAD(P)-binding protein [Nocardioides sp. GY 10127]|uniref:NmrA family NAD(P)-binding protein n=1 Tax=Nocardioides sp. GY 10127 TaxID=2569762 RepID=UPI0010A821A9|nr:NmrA family NAD(P)-binding protein [Nocardioides sp. GY 10127]TIC84370.1 KR domain-containing protein [Nocardioides sp. GY 10127]